MAGGMSGVNARTGMKLLVLLAALALIGLLVTGVPAREPAKEPIAAQVPTKVAPAVVAPVAAAAEPVAADDPFVIKRILKIDGPFHHGAYVWDDKNVPPGPIVITVDLAAQTLSVFRGGYEIGAAVILHGANDKPTPLGRFPITQKDADHVSNLYDAPMPYMLRLTNDGVAIHGSEVDWGLVTHGCVGVPTAFAKLLFGQAKLGDVVIITDGKMMDVGQPIIAS